MFELHDPAFRVTLDWTKRVYLTPDEMVRFSVPGVWKWNWKPVWVFRSGTCKLRSWGSTTSSFVEERLWKPNGRKREYATLRVLGRKQQKPTLVNLSREYLFQGYYVAPRIDGKAGGPGLENRQGSGETRQSETAKVSAQRPSGWNATLGSMSCLVSYRTI